MRQGNTTTFTDKTNRKFNPVACLLVFLLLLALAFCATLPVMVRPNHVFAFNDGNIEVVLNAAFRWPDAMLRVWDNQMFFGNAGGMATFAASGALESLLGPHHYRREGVIIAIVFTGPAFYWAMRQFGRSRCAAFLAAVFAMLCGWNLTFPMNGLVVRSYSLAFVALSLGMVERALRTGRLIGYAVGGGLLGLAVSESPDLGILFALSCGAYVAFRLSASRGTFQPSGLLVKRVTLLAVYVAASIAVAWQVINIMFATQISGISQGGSESAKERYAWATQWSVPKIETWGLIAPNFFGGSSRSPRLPYWGGIGRSEGWEQTKKGYRNFSLAGYALGTTAVVFLVVLYAHLWTARKNSVFDAETTRSAWFILAGALVCLMLAWGRHFPLYRLFYALPYMGTIRNPDKWLGPFTLFVGLAFALAVDLVIALRNGRSADNIRFLKTAGAIAAILPAIAIVSAFYLLGSRQHFVSSAQSEGYGEAAGAMWNNAMIADVGVILASVLTFGILWRLLAQPAAAKSEKQTWWSLGFICLIMVAELLRAGMPFVEAHAYKHVLLPNPLTRFLDENRTNGRVKLFPSQHPLMNHLRMTYLMVNGYDVFDPISVSRMPADYNALFEALGRDPVRLWQLGSVRYFLCTPDAIPEMRKLESPRGRFEERMALGIVPFGQEGYLLTESAPPQQRLIRLVEFSGGLPMVRFVSSCAVLPDTAAGDGEALKRISSPEFDPAQEAVIQGCSEDISRSQSLGAVSVMNSSPTHAGLKVEVPASGLLVRAVKYHPDWKVLIDGGPAKLFRANYLFQAVFVPSGSHEVEFDFAPSLTSLYVSVAGRLALLVGIAIFLCRRCA